VIKPFIMTAGFIAALLLSGPVPGLAQYYYYYYPRPVQPQMYRQQPHIRNSGGRAPQSNVYRHRQPSRHYIRNWIRHRNLQDYLNTMRSPLNPETSLEHMLRTF
jgi:hypothetical protein